MTPSDGFTGVSETENTIGQRAVEDLTPTINNPTDTKITTVVTENSLTKEDTGGGGLPHLRGDLRRTDVAGILS